MAQSRIVLGLLLAAARPAAAGTPVAKVLELLGGLEQKITKEGAESAKVHATVEDTCKDKSKDLGFAIETGSREVEGLQAAIAKEESKSGALSAKIEKLVAAIAEAGANLKAAQEVRSADAADFAAEEKELLSLIDTMSRAIGILDKELNGASASASMLQVKNAQGLTQALEAMVQASMLGSADAQRLTALAQTSSATDADSDDAGAPDAAVYENKSGGIIDTLNGLMDQAQGQLSSARKKETDSKHKFAMEEQALNDSMKYSNKDLSETKAALTESGEAKATATGDLGAASKALAEDKNDLAELKQYCASEADDYATEQKNRGEELAAIKAAVSAISDATGAASTLDGAASFLQRSQEKSDMGFQAARFLRKLAHGKDGSAELAQLASRVSSTVRLAARAGGNPFEKVKGLISNMISKLEKEASADATKKAYCDKETADATSSKNDKAANVEKLSVKIEKMQARSASLKEEVAALGKELAALAATQVKMDKVRSEEKAIFAEAKPELEAGIKGVEVGTKILKDYYAASDSGNQGAIQSILGFLEVIASDFAKALSERVGAEEAAQSEYEKMSKENELTKAAQEQDVKYKSEEITTLASDIAATSKDREGVQTELDSVNEYIAELNKMCVAKAETYEERAARRAAELAGLKDALDILENEAGFLQRGSLRGVRRHA